MLSLCGKRTQQAQRVLSAWHVLSVLAWLDEDVTVSLVDDGEHLTTKRDLVSVMVECEQDSLGISLSDPTRLTTTLTLVSLTSEPSDFF